MKKDAVITVRLPRATRRRLQALARREARSLSQQVERLIAQGLGGTDEESPRLERARSLSGVLRGRGVPTLRDFRSVRTLLSASLRRGSASRG